MPADPKAQKKDNQVKQLFALSGSADIKAVCKNVDPWCQFHQRITSSFFVRMLKVTYNVRTKKLQKRAFVRKSCSKNVGEIAIHVFLKGLSINDVTLFLFFFLINVYQHLSS